MYGSKREVILRCFLFPEPHNFSETKTHWTMLLVSFIILKMRMSESKFPQSLDRKRWTYFMHLDTPGT